MIQTLFFLKKEKYHLDIVGIEKKVAIAFVEIFLICVFHFERATLDLSHFATTDSMMHSPIELSWFACNLQTLSNHPFFKVSPHTLKWHAGRVQSLPFKDIGMKELKENGRSVF